MSSPLELSSGGFGAAHQPWLGGGALGFEAADRFAARHGQPDFVETAEQAIPPERINREGEAVLKRCGDSLVFEIDRNRLARPRHLKQAVDRQLTYFEDELQRDLIRLAQANGTGLHEPALTAKAITRLVFTMGATAMELPAQRHAEFTEQVVAMVRMIVVGTQAMAAMPSGAVVR